MSRIARHFISGLLAALPIAVTVSITGWVVALVATYLGPESFVGKILTSLGLSVSDNTAASYAFGVLIVISAIYVLGLLVEIGLGSLFTGLLDAIIMRVPLVSNVYDLSKRFVSIVDTKGGDNLKSMTAVWCFFGGEPGAATLGLMPSSEPIVIGTESYLGVLIPSAPVPVGGALVYVPKAWVRPADIGVEELMSVYVSMGVTPPVKAKA